MSSGYVLSGGRVVACGDTVADARFNALVALRAAARDLVAELDGFENDPETWVMKPALTNALERCRTAEDTLVGCDFRESRPPAP